MPNEQRLLVIDNDDSANEPMSAAFPSGEEEKTWRTGGIVATV